MKISYGPSPSAVPDHARCRTKRLARCSAFRAGNARRRLVSVSRRHRVLFGSKQAAFDVVGGGRLHRAFPLSTRDFARAARELGIAGGFGARVALHAQDFFIGDARVQAFAQKRGVAIEQLIALVRVERSRATESESGYDEQQ